MTTAEQLLLNRVADDIEKTPGRAVNHTRAAEILRLIGCVYSAQGLHRPEEYKLLEEIGLDPRTLITGQSRTTKVLGGG